MVAALAFSGSFVKKRKGKLVNYKIYDSAYFQTRALQNRFVSPGPGWTEIAQIFLQALGNQPKISARVWKILTSLPACDKHKRNNLGALGSSKFVK